MCEGVFAVYKPLGITSQRAVQIVKYWARRESGDKKIRVGHGGTLDPLAEGVLVIAVGRAYTRTIETHVAATKEYRAEITLGASSTTDDAEGDKTPHPPDKPITRAMIEEVLPQFVGDVQQVPPAYSAIKIDGQEAYKRVRRGEEVIMGARHVRVDAITVDAYDYPRLAITVRCGKGTYIRSLARDIGVACGTAGYLTGLVRTRVGSFGLDDCRSLATFQSP